MATIIVHTNETKKTFHHISHNVTPSTQYILIYKIDGEPGILALDEATGALDQAEQFLTYLYDQFWEVVGVYKLDPDAKERLSL